MYFIDFQRLSRVSLIFRALPNCYPILTKISVQSSSDVSEIYGINKIEHYVLVSKRSDSKNAEISSPFVRQGKLFLTPMKFDRTALRRAAT